MNSSTCCSETLPSECCPPRRWDVMRKILLVLFFTGMVGGLLFGAPGMWERLMHGHVNANYGSIVTWGLWVACYIYFIGLSAGAFLISSLVFVFGMERFEKVGRMAILTACVTLVMALISIGLDLGHMFRSWHVYVYPNFGSPMAWMIWLYSSYMLLLFGEAYFLMRRDIVDRRSEPGLIGWFSHLVSVGVAPGTPENRKADLRVVKILATIGVPLALMFHGGVGSLFGVLASRPLWHSGLYPVLFILSAVVSGGAAITMLSYVFLDKDPDRPAVIRSMGTLVLGVLIFETLWEIAEIGVYMYGRMPSHMAAWEVIMNGPYPYVFWIGQVFFGMLIPILLLVVGVKKHCSEYITLGCLSIVFGFLSVRLNMVIPAMSIEEIRGAAASYVNHRWTSNYLPSLMEWQVAFFITGLGGLLMTLGWNLLPLKHKHN